MFKEPVRPEPKNKYESSTERMGRYAIENYEYSINIESEQDIEGNAIQAEISWIRFNRPEGEEFEDLENVEGKLYMPTGESNGELILFTPGFPGGNAGRFELRYAKEFTDAGYAFFTVRHNGTSLRNLETAEEIVNCSERLDRAQELREDHIGGTREHGHKPVEIMKETATPLMALYDKFDKVHLMGQSMGVAASLHAATRAKHYEQVSQKLGNIVGIAGYVGKDSKEGELWDGIKIPVDEITQYERGYIKKVDANTTFGDEEISEAAKLNAQMDIPEHVGLVLMYTPNDPLVAEPDKTREDFELNYGPLTQKKIIVRDESNLNAPKQHSMLWIEPQNLLRGVQVEVSEHGPRNIKLPRDRDNKGLVEPV